MKPSFRRVWPWLVLVLLVAGCGGSEDFIIGGNGPNPLNVTTRQVVVNHTLAVPRTVEAGIVAFQFSGLDSEGGLVYGPEVRSAAATIELAVPVQVQELRIGYLDAGGDIVGVYQQDLPSGDGTVTITDPDFIDAPAFVTSITLAPSPLELGVGEGADLAVTALLTDGTTFDVSQDSLIVSNNPQLATVSGLRVTGVAEGATQLRATLFNKSASANVTVDGLVETVGLLSSTDGVTPGDGDSRSGVISADGRYVAFESNAESFGETIAEGVSNIWLKDRQTGELTLLSEREDGSPTRSAADDVSINHDGTVVVFSTFDSLLAVDDNEDSDVYLYDIAQGQLELVSLNAGEDGAGNGDSFTATFCTSNDGRYVVFASTATDIVSGDSNGLTDVFVRDRQSGSTERVSLTSDEGQANNSSDFATISGDGNIVHFQSRASNLTALPLTTPGELHQVYRRDRGAGTTRLLSTNAAGTAGSNSDVFPGWISEDGSLFTLEGFATDLVSPPVTGSEGNLYLGDAASGEFQLVSANTAGDALPGYSFVGGVDDSGRYVLFTTQREIDGFVYIKDTATGELQLAVVNAQGLAPNDTAFASSPALTGDGRTLVFTSAATNLAVQSVAGGLRQVYAAFNPLVQESQ